MPCYEKVLTRFSQVGAPKQKVFGLSVKLQTLPIFANVRSRIKYCGLRISHTTHTADLCCVTNIQLYKHSIMQCAKNCNSVSEIT